MNLGGLALAYFLCESVKMVAVPVKLLSKLIVVKLIHNESSQK